MSLIFILNLLGAAVFAVSGVLAAGRKSLDLLGVVVIAIIMGVITGVAGGVVRDTLTAEIPLISRRGHLYAPASITGAALYLLLVSAGVPRPLPALIGMVAVVLLRFASIFWGLQLPVLTLPGQPVAGRARSDDERAE